MIAVSLAIYLQPFQYMSAPIVMLEDQTSQKPDPLSFSEVVGMLLGSWQMRMASFSVSVGTLMHLIATVLGLTGFRRWLSGVGLPLLGVIAWHFGSSDRKFFTVFELAIFSTIIFTVGFGVVSYFFHAIFSSLTEPNEISQ